MESVFRETLSKRAVLDPSSMLRSVIADLTWVEGTTYRVVEAL